MMSRLNSFESWTQPLVAFFELRILFLFIKLFSFSHDFINFSIFGIHGLMIFLRSNKLANDPDNKFNYISRVLDIVLEGNYGSEIFGAIIDPEIVAVSLQIL